jgi:uncharacterized protein
MSISRRKFLKLSAGGVIGLGASTVAGGVYVTKIEPEALDITHLDVALPNLGKAFDRMTLVQIGDLHFGDWMTPERMQNVTQQVNALQPDIIAITGDFVSGGNPQSAVEAARAVSKLVARERVFAILGNHDYWMDRAIPVRNALADTTNIFLMRNMRAAIERGGQTLYMAGIDDVWEHHQKPDDALNGIPDGSAVIALVHEPDFADELAKRRQVGLQLSGHSHGGQVRLPGIGALALPWLGQKYDMGHYAVDGMALYVNRGLGMIRPFVRFNCRPEITHITLRA